MARTLKNQYVITTWYSQGWENRTQNSIAKGHTVSDETEALIEALQIVAEMRQAGADTPMREVTVRVWPQNGSLKDAATIFEASYFDPEQNLTDEQVFAARVHGWHYQIDTWNINSHLNNGRYFMGYENWPIDLGPQPDHCPHCGLRVHTRIDDLLMPGGRDIRQLVREEAQA
jgi:hypothetical protein